MMALELCKTRSVW